MMKRKACIISCLANKSLSPDRYNEYDVSKIRSGKICFTQKHSKRSSIQSSPRDMNASNNASRDMLVASPGLFKSPNYEFGNSSMPTSQIRFISQTSKQGSKIPQSRATSLLGEKRMKINNFVGKEENSKNKIKKEQQSNTGKARNHEFSITSNPAIPSNIRLKIMGMRNEKYSNRLVVMSMDSPRSHDYPLAYPMRLIKNK